ncbi:MAG: MmgE/PrpD family protein [Pseudomonadota bacterium]
MPHPLLVSLRDLCLREVPDDAARRAALHVADWLGCAVAGAATPPGQAFRREAAVSGGDGPVRSVGHMGRLPVRQAAFLMGALGNPLEMDDLDKRAILHPGPAIVPAALAAAQLADASGPDLLRGIVRGYEATIRLGRSVGAGHYAQWHTTATCGPLGAAVASASIFGLDPEETLWAMGNALTQASGPWACRHEDVMTKQLHAAHAAEAGVSAALLARAGVTGPAHILDGPQGFYAGMCPDPAPEAITADPEAWRIFEVSFKPWPACRHCHPAIDAALALRPQVPATATITGIEISVYGDSARFCDRAHPTTDVEAKFSLQHAVAVALLRGRPTIPDFGADARADEALAALRLRAQVRVDPALEAAYPGHYGARLALQLADGRRLEETRADAFGDPEDPMSDREVAAKATGLMIWAGLSKEEAGALLERAAALPDMELAHWFAEALPMKIRHDQPSAA